jgi:predicted RecA/RadA family phage recombinase
MATNHIQGQIETFNYIATAPVMSGEVVVMNDVTGVALGDADVDDEVAVAVTGVFALPTAAAGALDQGATVDWSGTEVVAGAGAKIGVMAETSQDGSDMAYVRLER